MTGIGMGTGYILFLIKAHNYVKWFPIYRVYYCLFLTGNYFIVTLTARSYRDCHLLGMRNFRSSDFTAICQATSEIVHHIVINNGFRSCETSNLYICSGVWGPTRHLSLKITNSFVIFRLRKPLKTSTRLAGQGIWTRDLPNASLVRYHGATSLGIIVLLVLFLLFFWLSKFCWSAWRKCV